MFEDRTYRKLVEKKHLFTFQVRVKESDLLVHANKDLSDITRELLLKYRGYLESYIQLNPDFARSLKPVAVKDPVPLIITDMAQAAQRAGVGPMASVAGAVAEHVAKDLLAYSPEVIVENGGDVFIQTRFPVTVGIYAGRSPLSMQIGLKVDTVDGPLSVCTSSGRIGHSLSFGKADAVCVVAQSCALADASATAIANQVKSKKDIQPAVNFGKKIAGLKGIVIVFDDQIGFWGEVEVVPLRLKKG